MYRARHAKRGQRGATRFAAAGTLAVLLTPALAAPALAVATSPQETTAPIASSAWFWKHVASAAGTPADPLSAQEPSQVPAGDLAVAADVQGQPTKETFLAFDLSDVPAQAELAFVSLRMPLDTAATQMGQTQQSLRVCVPTAGWPSGAGNDWSRKPAENCGIQTKTSYDATTSTYTFDLGALADALLAPDATGIAIGPAPATAAAAAPYQLVFKPATAVTLAIAWTLPAAASTPAGSSSQPTNAGPVTPVPVPAVGEPSVVTAPVTPSQQPVVAGAAKPVQVARAATAAFPVPSPDALPGGFLLALVAGALVIAALAALLHESGAEPADVIVRLRAARRTTA